MQQQLGQGQWFQAQGYHNTHGAASRTSPADCWGWPTRLLTPQEVWAQAMHLHLPALCCLLPLSSAVALQLLPVGPLLALILFLPLALALALALCLPLLSLPIGSWLQA